MLRRLDPCWRWKFRLDVWFSLWSMKQNQRETSRSHGEEIQRHFVSWVVFPFFPWTLTLPPLPPLLAGMNYLIVLRVNPHLPHLPHLLHLLHPSISLSISAGQGVLCCSQGQMQSCDGGSHCSDVGKRANKKQFISVNVKSEEQRAAVFPSRLHGGKCRVVETESATLLFPLRQHRDIFMDYVALNVLK